MSFLAYFINDGKCYLCEKEGDAICEKCFSKLDLIARSEILPDFKLTSFYNYNEIASKILIMSKYPPYYFYLLKYLIRNTLLPKFKENSLFCPVPLSSLRMFERKFNQAELIAQEFTKKQELPVFSILKRVKETNALFELGKKERLQEMESAFKVSFFGKLLPKKESLSLILVDDLVTTTSTASQCVKVLKNSGFKNVEVLSLFRA